MRYKCRISVGSPNQQISRVPYSSPMNNEATLGLWWSFIRTWNVDVLLNKKSPKRDVVNCCVFQIFVLCVYPFPGPLTSPIGLDSHISGILMYLCVRISDVVFYGHQIQLGVFVGHPFGGNTFSKMDVCVFADGFLTSFNHFMCCTNFKMAHFVFVKMWAVV